MKKLYFLAGALLAIGCMKSIDRPRDHKTDGDDNSTSNPSQYSTFTIQQGAHYCDQNTIKSVKASEMKFMVRFDNSAVYQTVNPENQYAINKLWGFSEDIDNHNNSARIGWSWTNDSLRLYGYVYVNNVLHYQEITTVTIGAEITCNIKLAGNSYHFTVNGVSISLPRGPSTSQVDGYQQYPYFGGAEVAPHLITILIKSL